MSALKERPAVRSAEAHGLATRAHARKVRRLRPQVEGAESLVMESFPWARYNISVLTIERPKLKLISMLQQHRYAYHCTPRDPSLGKGAPSHDEIWVHTLSMPGVPTSRHPSSKKHMAHLKAEKSLGKVRECQL